MKPNLVHLEIDAGKGNVKKLTGWTRLVATRGIERFPNSFELQMTEAVPDFDYVEALPGNKCRVLIDDDVVLTGYVDKFIPSINGNQHIIQIVGRGLCCDLVDCSAEWLGMQFLNVSAQKIAESLAAPYGIKVVAELKTDQISVQNLNLGESPAAVLDRVCKVAQLLCYENENGELVLSRERGESATGGLKQGDNVEQANLVYGMDLRYSDYVAVYPSAPLTKDVTNGVSIGFYPLNDESMPRRRLLYILPEEGDAGFVVAKKRVEWEMKRRLARSFMLRATVSTWRDADGKLWTPNTQIAVDIPSLKIGTDKKWLIGEVTYRYDETGTHCDMLIMPVGAFTPQPIVGFPADKDVANAYLLAQGKGGITQ